MCCLVGGSLGRLSLVGVSLVGVSLVGVSLGVHGERQEERGRETRGEGERQSSRNVNGLKQSLGCDSAGALQLKVFLRRAWYCLPPTKTKQKLS